MLLQCSRAAAKAVYWSAEPYCAWPAPEKLLVRASLLLPSQIRGGKNLKYE